MILKPNNESLTKTDRIYYYMLKHAVGHDKMIKSSELMSKFKINDNKTFRSHIEEIRLNDKYDKIICSEAGIAGGYYIGTTEEEIIDTLEHLYKRSMQMLKTYSRIKQKAIHDKHCKLKLNEMEQEYETAI